MTNRKVGLILTKSQWSRTSELLGNLGLALWVSIAIPALLDNFNLGLVVLGLSVGFLSIYLSVMTARNY